MAHGAKTYLNSVASFPHTALFLLIARTGINMESPLLILKIGGLVLRRCSRSNRYLLDSLLGVPFLVSIWYVQRNHVVLHCDLDDGCNRGM
jgi:hypothetical protein